MTDLAALAKPFPQSVIEKVPVGGGFEADYVTASVVIEKLLATVGPFDWSVDLRTGKPCIAVGTLTVEIDGRRVSVQGVGEDTDAKSAESDALKRAARMIGVGLHLWSQKLYRLDKALNGDTGSPAVSSGRGAPPPPAPNLDTLRVALKAKVERLNTNHHECWEAWKADNDGWWTTVDGLTAADTEVVRMLQAQGADPFLDDAAGSASLESGGAGGGGDEAASTDESAVPPPAADLTNTGGDDTQGQPTDGVVRETERSGDPDPPVEPPPGSGSSAPNPVTQARKKAAKT